MLLLRHALGLCRDLVAHAVSSGRWWLPVVVVVLALAGLVALTVKVVVPSAVYVLF